MYKKLIIVLVLVAALMLDAVPVQAAESNGMPFSDPYEYLKSKGYNPNDYPYYVVYWSEDSKGEVYRFLFSQERFVVKYSPASSNYSYVDIVPSEAYWDESHSSWKSSDSHVFCAFLVKSQAFFSINTTGYIRLLSLCSPGFDVIADKIVYSNYNIFDEENNLVFPTAPMKGHPAVEELVLGTLITHPMMEPVMTEILGLIPLVICLVIFYLGLRKAYQFLVENLRKA